MDNYAFLYKYYSFVYDIVYTKHTSTSYNSIVKELKKYEYSITIPE